VKENRTISSPDQFEDGADTPQSPTQALSFTRRMPIFLARRRAMVEPKKNDKPMPITKQFDAGIDPNNSLLPMLIGGLVLIVIGAIIVMMFV